jgi:hypothetical protein
MTVAMMVMLAVVVVVVMAESPAEIAPVERPAVVVMAEMMLLLSH